MVNYPADWEAVKLKDIGHIQMCRRIFQKQTKKSGDIPFFKISTFGKNADSYISRELFQQYKTRYPYPEVGDILLSTAGTIGRTVIFDGKNSYFQDSNIVWLKVDKNIVNRKFLWWIYRSFPWQGLEGTTIQRLYNKIILNTEIYLPTLREQQAIADTLSTFDTYISNLTELIEKKKAIREGALEDLVSGKTRLEGFGGEWKKGRLLDFTKIKRGKRVVRSQLYTTHKKETFPVYQNSLEPLGYFNDYNCRRNSVFVIAAGNAGDIGFSNENFWAADDCYSFEHTDNVSQKFLLYLLLSRQQEISAQTRRTSIPRLSRDILENLLVMLPKQNEQQAIVNTLTAMDDEIRNLETELDKMKQIREGAMDDLLTGRIRLPL